MTEIMPVPRNLNLLSYQQGALRPRFFVFGLRLLNAQRDAFAVYLPVLHIAG